MKMLLLLLAMFVAVNGDDYFYESGNQEIIPVVGDDSDNAGAGSYKYGIVGGILGGLAILIGLALFGRRMLYRRKEKDDKDLDYDYYGIMQRRYCSEA